MNFRTILVFMFQIIDQYIVIYSLFSKCLVFFVKISNLIKLSLYHADCPDVEKLTEFL